MKGIIKVDTALMRVGMRDIKRVEGSRNKSHTKDT